MQHSSSSILHPIPKSVKFFSERTVIKQKDQGKLVGLNDLVYYPKDHGDLVGFFDITYDPPTYLMTAKGYRCLLKLDLYDLNNLQIH